MNQFTQQENKKDKWKSVMQIVHELRKEVESLKDELRRFKK